MENNRLRILVEFYEKQFSGNVCELYTNYKPLEIITIHFPVNGLPHLLGLHKVTSVPSASVIKGIKSGEISIKSIKGHANFNKIRYRIENFEKIEDMLKINKVKSCVLKKDSSHNEKYLDLDVCVFDHIDNNRLLVLGLRKDKNNNIFYPTSILKTGVDKFRRTKRTIVRDVKWK